MSRWMLMMMSMENNNRMRLKILNFIMQTPLLLIFLILLCLYFDIIMQMPRTKSISDPKNRNMPQDIPRLAFKVFVCSAIQHERTTTTTRRFSSSCKISYYANRSTISCNGYSRERLELIKVEGS